jgi:hypothetical protein
MYKYSKLVFFIITLIAFFYMAGCTSSFFKNWGRIEPDANVTDSFNKFQINANFNYYISGSDVYPTSIMGLNKSYKLETDLWKQIDMTPELFSELVTNMRHDQYSAPPKPCMDFIYLMIKIIKLVFGIL